MRQKFNSLGALYADRMRATVFCAELLAGIEPPLQTGLVIAESAQPLADSLTELLPGSAWIAATAAQLPESPPSYDAVVSIDTLVSLPRDRRAEYFQNLIRRAQHEVIATAPLGTNLQAEYYRSLNQHYRELFGQDQPELTDTLRHGLVIPDEALGWIPQGAMIDLFYAGDAASFHQDVEAELLQYQLGYWRWLFLRRSKPQLLPDTDRMDLPIETVPMRRHRRILLHYRRI